MFEVHAVEEDGWEEALGAGKVGGKRRRRLGPYSVQSLGAA